MKLRQQRQWKHFLKKIYKKYLEKTKIVGAIHRKRDCSFFYFHVIYSKIEKAKMDAKIRRRAFKH